VFASNHKPRRAVTALAIGNVSKQREATNGGHGNDGCATGGCCDTKPDQKPRSHDTSRIAWAKLMARVGEEFPLECPNCGGDIRLREDGRQELAHFEPEVRKREKARKASPGNGRLGHGLRRRQKNATAGDARRFGEPPPDGRNALFRCSRAVRQPEVRCGSAIDRAILRSAGPR
jgi:hypothetical protein